MGVRLRSRDQTAKLGMANEKFSSSEESTHEQIQGENHDYCFFDSRGIVHKEFVPPGQTVNHAFYRDVLGDDFENGSSESEGTLQTIWCCNTITRQLTLRFKFENFW